MFVFYGRDAINRVSYHKIYRLHDSTIQQTAGLRHSRNFRVIRSSNKTRNRLRAR